MSASCALLMAVFAVWCPFARGTPDEQQVLAFINQYCERQGCGNISALATRRGKAGPRGLPGVRGEPGNVDYNAINTTIAQNFQDIESTVNQTLAPIRESQRRSDRCCQKIAQLEGDLRSVLDEMIAPIREAQERCNRKISRLEEELRELQQATKWRRASDGMFYLHVSTVMTWEAANIDCRRKGGILASATIRNGKVRRELYSDLNAPRIWIGLTDIEREGSWVWQDGATARTRDSLWYQGEPNNAGGNEDCAYLLSTSGTWKANDAPCRETFGYLCEKSH